MGTKAPTKREGQQEYIDELKAGAEAAYRRGVHQALSWAAEQWTVAQISEAFKIAHDFRYDAKKHLLLLDELNEQVQQMSPHRFGKRPSNSVG
jgi:ATP:corrinoid adenosyltransferase